MKNVNRENLGQEDFSYEEKVQIEDCNLDNNNPLDDYKKQKIALIVFLLIVIIFVIFYFVKG